MDPYRPPPPRRRRDTRLIPLLWAACTVVMMLVVTWGQADDTRVVASIGFTLALSFLVAVARVHLWAALPWLGIALGYCFCGEGVLQSILAIMLVCIPAALWLGSGWLGPLEPRRRGPVRRHRGQR